MLVSIPVFRNHDGVETYSYFDPQKVSNISNICTDACTGTESCVIHLDNGECINAIVSASDAALKINDSIRDSDSRNDVQRTIGLRIATAMEDIAKAIWAIE